MITEEMALIPSGTFIMGSPESEYKRNITETQHEVTISKPFYMGKYEVTQAEWKSVMRSNPSYHEGDDLPVEQVSWYDALEYCNKRSKNEGLPPVYKINGNNVKWDRGSNGYRLPTEAEWEYACRAGTTTPFNTGYNITTDQANYDGDYPYNGNAKGIYRGKTTPVGSFPPNAWGLYDMHGNVYEWCWDWYDDNSEYDSNREDNDNYDITVRIDSCVLRGGGWDDLAANIRSAESGLNSPSYRSSELGFRIVRSI